MSMHHWHYANRSGHQQGPVDANSLRAAFARGDVDAGSLVWRDGLAQWVTLADVAGELGIPVDALPPPNARPFATAGMAPVAAYPAKKGMSGGTIALIIAGVAVVLIAPLAIIAAIAIAQYQDYVAKAQFSEAVYLSDTFKDTVAAHYQASGTCPADADMGGAAVQGKYVGRVEFPGGPTPCAIVMVFADREPTAVALRGARVSFLGTPTADGMAWQCRSGLPDKYKPAACREGN